ncbi:preprotein translocase subunit SecG [Chitinophaga sp. GCM10012297]|uniref:preprotein translocase subunit SecG n=1 Tax=Chitinophaga TaxID=79328 RepID=UPI001F2CA9BE|nr:preprotein translocase subunit SecG [Chitinophaga chungangae]
MLIFFGILIVLACVLLGFFVLVQNPKGGGLSGSFGGFGNQVMGVRQTTDVLEKGTWILAAVIAVLCLTSAMFVSKGPAGAVKGNSAIERAGGGPAAPAGNTQQFPTNQAPANQTTPPATPADSGK